MPPNRRTANRDKPDGLKGQEMQWKAKFSEQWAPLAEKATGKADHYSRNILLQGTIRHSSNPLMAMCYQAAARGSGRSFRQAEGNSQGSVNSLLSSFSNCCSVTE